MKATDAKKSTTAMDGPVARVAIACPHCGKEFAPEHVAQVRSVLSSEDAEEPKTMLDAMSAEIDRTDREE
jgi:hypothetical protein